MDCDRYHLYHASWAYSVRGLASRSDGGQGLPGLFIGYGLLAGLLFALWRGYGWARWLLFGLCHRVAVDSAPSLRLAVCIRNFESDSPDHRGITAVRHAERCFILGRPTSCRIFCTDSDSYSNAYSFTDSDSYSNAFTNGYAYAGPDHAQRPGEKGGGNKYGASQMEAGDLGQCRRQPRWSCDRDNAERWFV